jgi:peptidoglycan/xylan/chitin deacetylase (PgdA/CDA1 family)
MRRRGTEDFPFSYLAESQNVPVEHVPAGTGDRSKTPRDQNYMSTPQYQESDPINHQANHDHPYDRYEDQPYYAQSDTYNVPSYTVPHDANAAYPNRARPNIYEPQRPEGPYDARAQQRERPYDSYAQQRERPYDSYAQQPDRAFDSYHSRPHVGRQEIYAPPQFAESYERDLRTNVAGMEPNPLHSEYQGEYVDPQNSYEYERPHQEQPRRRTLNRQIQILSLIAMGLFLLVLLLAYFAFPGLRAKKSSGNQNQIAEVTDTQMPITLVPTITVPPTISPVADGNPLSLANIPPSKDRPVIALTFEDGPEGANTAEILRILKEENVQATFFLLGSQVEKSDAALVQQMVTDGHEIGNHSYDHKLYTELTEEQIREEIQMTNDIIFDAAGVYPSVMRPPDGSRNDTVLALSIELNIPIVNWSWQTNPQDISGENQTSEQIAQQVVDNAGNGHIVLLHDMNSETVKSVSLIIDQLTSEGFRFATVSELLAVSDEGYRTGIVYTQGTFA